MGLACERPQIILSKEGNGTLTHITIGGTPKALFDGGEGVRVVKK